MGTKRMLCFAQCRSAFPSAVSRFGLLLTPHFARCLNFSFLLISHQHNTTPQTAYKTATNNGCLLASPASRRPLTADILDTPNIPNFPTQSSTSEPSFLEPLNSSLALRSFSSPSPLPFDFTSSITASQQSSWLSSPAPHASRQPQNTSQTTFAHRQADFVLYDQPAQVSQRPLQAPSAPQPGHTFNNGQHFYANSAPSSTTEFKQPRLLQRPPVPLFSSSSNNIPQLHNVTNMAGTVRAFRYPSRELTFPADLNSNNSFDSGASLMSNFNNGAYSMDHASAFTAINDPSVAAASSRTVSPKDIFSDGFGSAPPSTAFTNLTSPDIGDSPFIQDPFECSPMFNGDAVISDTSDWFSLFPEQETKVADTVYAPAISMSMERTVSSQSMERSGSSSIGSPLVLDAHSRRKSSVTNSPATNGISKSRRRKGPLPNITVDPSDKIALKRARNTLAARESRQRKFDHVSTLEQRNSELEAEVEKWKSIALAHGYSGQ
ncbi:cross-pathway control protein 1 [Pyrenophora tritici-repentis]|uniref:Cross-pathway control protein n=3 Tax=Pyrenophora tritici-repentis TaxID=45151 RepID=A0A2W1H185_9PLEO|nr:Cross-pathway control protein [Pyrenophora tritici-repentis]KAI1583571.1 cross-pathway control protein 1 [Pyrenophora tritici-repentis]KAI1675319.1 Cross-pathway control protein [Pyrenophora tritici-repentis]KAI1687528.1 Cross-pathway control protein [Pyrenophora tritici-repentis]PZD00631.1 cross-pathway control protein 1 [Pyrenophora tritici-repentis]